MQFGMFNREIFKSTLTNRQKDVLLALIYHADKHSECDPSRGVLADLTGIHPNRISGLTSALEKSGWIEKSDGRGRGSCSYKILKGHPHDLDLPDSSEL